MKAGDGARWNSHWGGSGGKRLMEPGGAVIRGGGGELKECMGDEAGWGSTGNVFSFLHMPVAVSQRALRHYKTHIHAYVDVPLRHKETSRRPGSG